MDFTAHEIIRINSLSSKLRLDLICAIARPIDSRLCCSPFFSFAVWVGHKYQLQIQGRAMDKLRELAAEARLERTVGDWL